MPLAITCKKTVEVTPMEIEARTYNGQQIRKVFRFRDGDGQLYECISATDVGGAWVLGTVAVTESTITFTAN